MAPKFLLIAFAITASINVYSQNIIWEQNYGGSSNEFLTDMFQTSDNGFLTIGYSSSNDFNVDPSSCSNSVVFPNGYIVKTTSSLGQISWTKVLGGTDTDYLYAGLEISDGYLTGGISFSEDCDLTNTQNGAWLSKLNDNGFLQWTYTYQNAANSSLNYSILDIASNQSETQFLVGADHNFPNDVWLFTVDDFGIKDDVYEQSFVNHNLKGIKSTDDGGYLVYGEIFEPCNGVGSSSSDIWILKLSSSFITEWEVILGEDNIQDQISDLEVHNNGISLVGSSFMCEIPTAKGDGKVTNRSTSVLPDGNWGLHLNNSGIIQLCKEIDISAVDIDLTSEGNWLMVSSYAGVFDNCLLGICEDPRINCLLTQLPPLYYVYQADFDWNIECYNSYGGTDFEWVNKVEEIIDGSIIIGGHTESNSGSVSSNYGGFDNWLIEIEAFEQSDSYCKVNGYTFAYNEYTNFIDRFTFGDYYNYTDTNHGYGDYKNTYITVEPNTTLDLDVWKSPLSNDLPGYEFNGDDFTIWVDWNKNGDFTDVGEMTNYEFVGNNLLSTFSIPASATIGDTVRMRIGIFSDDITDGNGNVIVEGNTPDPCYSCFFGEYEDYSLVIDLIPNIDCTGGTTYVVVCDYQVDLTSYPDNINNNLSSVDMYSECGNPTKNLSDIEQCLEFFPDEAATEVTINLINLGLGDVDMIIMDKFNEKTGIIGCSQNGPGQDESITFTIDPAIDLYYIIVDGILNDPTEYIIQVDCNQNFDCFYGVTNEDYYLFHMNLENECSDLAYNNAFTGMPGEIKDFSIQLADGGFNVPPTTPPVSSYLRMWIDINGDGDFNNQNELFHNEFLNYDSDSYVESNFIIPNLSDGSYNVLIQLYATEFDVEPIVDPCLFWFGGGHSAMYNLTIGTNDPYCMNNGCTYCPASGGETVYLNEFQWGNHNINTGDNGGYLDNTDYILKAQVGTHPEIEIVGYDGCVANSYSYIIYIDFDGDGNFTDMFERVATSTTPTINANSNPFITALSAGTYRMRIKYEIDDQTLDPCATGYLGESEDYTLEICTDINDCINPPIADFVVDKNALFTNEFVNFSYDINAQILNESDYNPGTVSYSWVFEGGSPSTSTDMNPIIQYNTSGEFNVSLTVTNSVGNDIELKIDFITVLGDEDDCPNIKNVDDMLIETGLYQASQILNSAGVIDANQNVMFNAGLEINLNNNFEAPSSSILEININDCLNNN